MRYELKGTSNNPKIVVTLADGTSAIAKYIGWGKWGVSYGERVFDVEVDFDWEVEGMAEAVAKAVEETILKQFAFALYGLKEGQADWEESMITEHHDRIDEAREWAKQNGFVKFRVGKIELGTALGFAEVVK